MQDAWPAWRCRTVAVRALAASEMTYTVSGGALNSTQTQNSKVRALDLITTER